MSIYPEIKGFLTPAMVDILPGGRMLNAFSDPADVDRIEKGYACGNCCASFHTFQLNCPLCNLPTHVTKQREETPAMWQQHVDQRHADIPTLGTGKREPVAAPVARPRTPDEFLRDIAKDKDIDQVPLSKLRPSRHGRGKPR